MVEYLHSILIFANIGFEISVVVPRKNSSCILVVFSGIIFILNEKVTGENNVKYKPNPELWDADTRVVKDYEGNIVLEILI